MKKTLPKIVFFCFLLMTTSVSYLFAQNPTNETQCYKPLAGSRRGAIPINNNTVCVSVNTSPCNFITNAGNIVDGDFTNFATFNSTASLIAGNGVTVQDSMNTYPAGFFAGYIIDLGSATLLRADVLSAFTIRTYNNGVLQETSTSATLAAATAIGTSPGRVYLNFKTSLAFNEVRLTFNTTISLLTSFRIYYATAFDPNCGNSEDNGRCGDQIGGANTAVTFNGGALTNVLTSIANSGNITDGDKNSFATITIPVATGTLGPGADPYVGVLDEQNVYGINTVVGFVVSRPSILTLNVLSNVRIQTFLFGVLQDDATLSNGITSKAVVGSGDRTSLSIVTTKQYNEVRLVLTRTASVNIGTLRVYYAFEQTTTCTDCETNIVNPATGTPTNSISSYCPGVVIAGNCIGASRRTSELGIACVGTGGVYDLLNTGNVVDSDTTNYASYRYGSGLSVGLACGFQISVKMTTPVPANSLAGYVFGIDNGSANLLNLGLLNAITIVTYRNNVEVGRSTNSNLLSLSLLANTDGSKSRVSFIAPAAFDEVQIVFNPGVLSAGLLGLINNATIRTYYPFVIRDTDNDGVPDCQDFCPNGNDAIDTDNNGLPDCYEVYILPLTLSDFSARAVNNKQVVLSWQTLNETNTRQFIVERSSKPASVNSTDWQSAGTVTAAGTASGSRNYQLTDNQPFSGISYYRLRTIDVDGKQTFSNVKQVNLNVRTLLASAVYPNPVERGGFVTLTTTETERYRLLDQTGRLVSSGTFALGNSKLKAPSAAGAYILEVTGTQNDSNKEHHRIVVQ